jgi:hypothetical protein
MTTVKDYKDLITAEFMANRDAQRVYGFGENETFDSRFSAVSVESILFYVFAFGMWVIATLFEKHRTDVLANLEALKPHTLLWYVTKARAYQDGYDLPRDRHGQVIADVYDTIDESAKIVKYAVARERENTVVVKVAKHTSDDDRTPQKLESGELNGLRQYFSQVKDAGVQISIVSNEADKMDVEVTIYYNPMLLSLVDGVLKDTDKNDVVRNAIQLAVENLPFNGDCRTSDILNAVKNIRGVDVAEIGNVYVWRGDGGGEKVRVVGFYTPESGYFKLETLTINAEPYGVDEINF